ncbi:MAG TPA: hypothetical protein VJ860_13135 [Polyangia bacterium]|nr:hypothetical protein [Polyangia bacterium]
MLRRAAVAAALLASAYANFAWARTPPLAVDPTEGMWIGGGEVFIYQTPSRWSVFPAGANVNKIAVDAQTVWVATDDGVIRFDSRSRRATRITMDDGLPSQVVTAVAFDDQFVWFATNKGVARYRKLDRTIRVYGEKDGLPSKVVNDALTVGRQVWFATREGIAYYSPDVDGLRGFGQAAGLAGGDVAELYQVGDDLWCRTDVGLSRFRILQRVFSNFSLEMMKAQQVRVFTIDGTTVWVGTDNGLYTLDTSDDSLLLFPQQTALQSRNITGVEVDPSYVYITTDKEVVQFNRLTRSIRFFALTDNLTRQEGSIGTVLNGALWTVMFPDSGAQVFSVSVDHFVERKFALTENNENKTTAHAFGRVNAQTPYDFNKSPHWDPQRYDTGDANLSFGQSFSEDRNLSASARLDYGTLEMRGIRTLQYKVEYLGSQNDALRDVRAEDKLKYQTLEEGLERPLLLQGAYARVATPGAEPKASLSTTAGFRRGELTRDFITGPRQTMYQLSKKYIVPASERVYVDGELLTNGTDYTIVYTAGQLSFLNPERIDDLSVIWVEYEADLMPVKDLGSLSLLDMLPADNEVGTWAQTGGAQLITSQSGLYNQIDGGAPKYIDRGWVSSVYVTYSQGSRTIQVQIHDMGTDANAEGIFNYAKPTAWQPINGLPNAILDMSLASAYGGFAHLNRFYIELSITSKDDASRTTIELFTNQIINRKAQAGSNMGNAFKQWMVAARAAASPVHGMEIGARVVEMQDLTAPSQVVLDPNTGRPMLDAAGLPVQKARPARSLLTGVADARYQRAVGQGGLLTGYGEFAGSDRQDPGAPNGWAGTGFLRLSHSSLEGTISGRKDSQGFTPLGNDSTRFGKLADDLRLSATGYPVAWLPTTIFVDRQRSFMDDGTGKITNDMGTIQHALARIQLNKKGLPMTSVQVGSTILDNPNFSTNRLQAVGQTDYDLAQILSFTHIQRFSVRGLYSISQAETDKSGTFAFTDRVQLSRVEAKLSPTNTESIYGLFRSRLLEREAKQDGPFARSLLHWELYSGAKSTIIPGIAPTVTYTAIYDDNRLASSSTSTSTTTSTGTGALGGTPVLAPASLMSPSTSALTPVGPGAITVAPPTRAVQATIGGALGIFPGQWLKLLGPAAMQPQVSISDNETSVDQFKTQYNRVYRFDNRAVWASGGRFDLELYQLHQEAVTAQDHHKNAVQTLLQNRIVYRPIFSSPISLRLNYQDTRSLNVFDSSLKLPPWADQTLYQGILQWLMRWNQLLTTLSTFTFNITDTSNFLNKDPATLQVTVYSNRQYQVGPEEEFRFYPLKEAATLYLYQRDGLFRWFGHGDGASNGISYYVAAGGIWRMGDKVYLDGGVQYDNLTCLSQPSKGSACLAVSRITPRLYLTVNL